MLTRINRLSKQKDLAAIFKQPAVGAGGPLILKKTVNQQTVSRFTIVISAKVIKKAVSRNRLRRQLFEILRRHLAEIKPGRDIALILKKDLTGQQFEGLEAMTMNLFKKAGCL